MRPVSREEREAEPVGDRSKDELATELDDLRRRLDSLAEKVLARNAQVSVEEVRGVIGARALRFDLFKWGLFADPAWDMLLYLYLKKLEQQRVAVSKLCTASYVPETTALRRIDQLEREGLIARHKDHLDARRMWVELSPGGSSTMKSYFLILRERCEGSALSSGAKSRSTSSL